jgi:hypothetical protein
MTKGLVVISAADREAIREAMKSGLRVLEVQLISVAPELGEDAKTKLTAALALIGGW